MTAYVIFTVDKIHDPEKLNAYKRAAHPTITEKGGKVSVAYGRTEVLEGELIEGVVMVEFEVAPPVGVPHCMIEVDM